jgi:integrase/recombinase XerD
MQLTQARTTYVEWLTNVRHLSKHTLRAYASDLEQFERVAGASVDVRTVCHDHVITFVIEQRRALVAESSIKRRLATIRGFANWLAARELLAPDTRITDGIEARLVKRLPRAVPPPELGRLLRYLRLQAGCGGDCSDSTITAPQPAVTTLLAVALMISTGVRVGEVVTIRAAGVQLHDRSIRIVGKGSRERTVYFVGQWLEEMLATYLDDRTRYAVNHPYLLHLRSGGALTTDAVRRRLAVATQRAGISHHVTPHSLRHSAATLLIESGVDIRYVQRLLGHASISTTELYTHVADIALANAVAGAQVLNRLLERPDN